MARRHAPEAEFLQEDHTDRGRYFEVGRGRFKGARFLVDGEDMQVATRLVGGNDPPAAGIEIEVAGGAPPGLFDFDQA